MMEPFSLSSDNAIKVACRLVRQALAAGDSEYRRAAELIFQACQQGASQRQIGIEIGKPASTVNRLLAWRKSGYEEKTPFGAASKAKRERARVRPVEHSNGMIADPEQDQIVLAVARAKAAEAEASKAKLQAEKATAEAAQARAEAARERMNSANAYIPGASFNKVEQPLDVDLRRRLVKTLGMLGSDQAGERASAALIADRERMKLGMSWDDLIIRLQTNKSDDPLLDDDDLDVDDDDDNDEFDLDDDEDHSS